MTDITELALLVSKAKASVFTLEYISQFEPADIDSDDVDLRFEVDGRDTGTNVSIVDECGQAAKVIGTLVEALEKAQAVMNAVVTAADIRGIRPFDGIDCDPPTLEENAEACGDAMSARIRELEANPPKPHHNGLMQISNDLASAKQRIAELENYAEAEAVGADRAAEDGVYWMKRCKELESRTVKLPRPGFITISGERMAVYMKGEVVAALLAAGIKVEAE